jgi:putative FmdB family regulatory protein
MPLFDYQCRECGHDFEAFQGMMEQPLVTCPKCFTDALEKLLSAPHFTFGEEASAYKQLKKEEAKVASANEKKSKLTPRRSEVHIK